MREVYIIVPCYNVENYVEKCINSLLNQTYDNIKIICVNDGSTDDTLTKLLQFKSNKIILINQTNKGPGFARNSGLKYITNYDSYLTFVDSDDWVEEHYVERLVNILESNNSDIAVTENFVIKGDSIPKPFTNYQTKVILSDEAIKLIFSSNIRSVPYSKLFKSALWKNIQFPIDLSAGEDNATLFKPFLLSKSVCVSNYKGYYLNRYEEAKSIMRCSITNKYILSNLKGNLYTYNFLSQNTQSNIFIPIFSHEMIDNFLSLYPRYKYGTEFDLFINEYIKFIKSNKITKAYKPYNFESKTKIILFKIFPPKFYHFIFNCYINVFRRKYRYGVAKL
mgnify:CR=1 FL=1